MTVPEPVLIHETEHSLRMASSRSKVLRVYRQALKLARSWEAIEADQTAAERAYIREEASRLFRKNQHVCRAGRGMEWGHSSHVHSKRGCLHEV